MEQHQCVMQIIMSVPTRPLCSRPTLRQCYRAAQCSRIPVAEVGMTPGHCSPTCVRDLTSGTQRNALRPLHLHLVVLRSLIKIGDDCGEVQRDAVQMVRAGEGCTCNLK
jgi:hypothetical protein